MLEFRIKTFLCVAQEKNFTRASEKLCLTQPAVSHQIALLEEELGVKLFIRKRNDISLTPEGEAIYKYACQAEDLWNKTMQSLKEGNKHIRLRVGITHTGENNKITTALGQYSALNDNISLTVITDNSSELYKKLDNYELDFIVVDERIENKKFVYKKINDDTLVCVVESKSSLAKHKEISLKEIKKHPLIMRLPTSQTRTLFDSALLETKDNINNYNISLEVDSISTIKNLVSNGIGISILPLSSCLHEINKGKLTGLSIKELNLNRDTNIVYLNDFSYVDIINNIFNLYKKL